MHPWMQKNFLPEQANDHLNLSSEIATKVRQVG